jgi:hypothetical protein
MSQGSSRSNTPQLEHAFEEAKTTAERESDAVFTIERLLQRLLEEPEVRSALATNDVDVQALSSELTSYLQGVRKTDTGFSMVTDSKVRNVLQSIVVRRHVEGINRATSSLDVLAAIVGQGNSFAAERLSAYGFTAETAIDLADAHYVASGRANEAELQQTKAKLALLPKQGQTRSETMPDSAQGAAKLNATSTADYKIVVVSRDAMSEAQFKGAISADGSLTLLVETTPFEIDFLASEIVALFETVSDGEGISVELLATQSDGTVKIVSGFGGQSGAILKNRKDLNQLWTSGYLR